VALTVGSLFAGIGGFDLGLERAGMQVKWQVEIDPFCQRVLEKHWPGVMRLGDIKEAVGYRFGVYGYIDYHAQRHLLKPVDVICGGFPCQDISLAGPGTGLAGERSGLWREYLRLVRELRPRYVIVENVAALLGRGLGTVLGDLAACGYDAEWDCLPAAAFGAKHLRERIWIVAYAHGAGPQERRLLAGIPGPAGCPDERQDAALGAGWAPEPDVVRVVHGISGRVDRIRALGNSVVPQIAEWIGRRIIEAEATTGTVDGDTHAA
jgi:DNA (cytosine-5)-methyltransferase 1